MDRLTQQLARLYLPHGSLEAIQTSALPVEALPVLAQTGDRVRAAIMGIRRPADWRALATVWQGIQDDFSLPPPAIAVNGSDALCLWFSFEQDIPAATATQWLNGLQQRYLPALDPVRVLQWPSGTGTGTCRMVPAPGEAPGRWSAFVTAGMVSVFADEPWLEQAPNPDAQADLLSGLKSMPLTDVEEALRRFAAVTPITPIAQAATPGSITSAPQSHPGPVVANPVDSTNTLALQVDQSTWTDPRDFLLAVMNDPAVPLALRLEAAKSLLPLAAPRN